MGSERLSAIAMALAVVISGSATTHFSLTTLVAWPCTISPSMSGISAVACAAAQNTRQTARVSYAVESDAGDMMMTVEF